MERAAAIKLNEMLLDCYSKLHESTDIVRQDCGEDERKEYGRALEEVSGYLRDVLEPIYREHPDLRPEQLK
jgi:hypothetical protein